MDGRQVLEAVAGLVKGGAYLEVFAFPIKGKPEPCHASLVLLPWAWAKMEMGNRAGRLLNELILSKLLEDEALEVDAHVSVAVELDANRAFRLG